MTQVVSQLLKINLRMRSRENIGHLLCDVLGGSAGHDRGSETIGEFEGSTFVVGGVTFDVVVPSGPDAPLSKVIDKHGEGIDSICYAVDDMDHTQAQLQTHGIEFSRLTEFHGNKVAFVHPRDACGIALEFIQGPLVEKAGS
jgi:hypothetical protein